MNCSNLCAMRNSTTGGAWSLAWTTCSLADPSQKWLITVLGMEHPPGFVCRHNSSVGTAQLCGTSTFGSLLQGFDNPFHKRVVTITCSHSDNLLAFAPETGFGHIHCPTPPGQMCPVPPDGSTYTFQSYMGLACSTCHMEDLGRYDIMWLRSEPLPLASATGTPVNFPAPYALIKSYTEDLWLNSSGQMTADR